MAWAIGRAPGKIRIVRAGFNDIVLEIILVHQYQPFLVGQVGKLLRAIHRGLLEKCRL